MNRAPRRPGVGKLPAFAHRLMRWSLPKSDWDALVGDLVEEMSLRLERDGERAARRWLSSQIARSLLPNLKRKLTQKLKTTDTTRRPRPGEPTMRTALKDLRFALRTFSKRPFYTAVLLLTLGLGIGATTVILSAVDGVVLDPFPFPDPETLVGIGPAYPKLNQELSFREVISPPEYLEIRDQSQTLSDVVAFDMGHRQISGEGEPERVLTGFWYGDALKTLRMPALAGRGFLDQDFVEGGVVILSHRLWQRRFGGDRSVVGKRLWVNGNPHTVVGVLAPRVLLYGMDLWMPMSVDPNYLPRTRRIFNLLARIEPAHDLDAVNAELETIAGRIEAAHVAELEEYQGWKLEAAPWTEINVEFLRPVATLLLGAVGFALLLVCVNVANLQLAQSAARQQEIALRRALGAGRSRIARQLLTESLLLGLLGGLLGVGLAFLGVKGLTAFFAALSVPLPGVIEINGRVLLVTTAISLSSGLLFGLAPALHVVRHRIRSSLGASSAGVIRSRQRLQRLFVGIEVALALVLLFGCGLLVHSLLKLQQIDTGYASQQVLTLRITLPWEKYEQATINDFFRTLTEEIEARPGVEAATVSSQLPSGVFLGSRFSIDGSPPTDEGALPTAYVTAVAPNYFKTLRIPVLRGRSLEESDHATAPKVALVNETTANRYFPDRNPLGQRIKLGAEDSDEPWFEIVGVVADVRNRGLDQPAAPELFASTRQGAGANQLFVLIRSELDPTTMASLVREEVKRIDPDQLIYATQTLNQTIALTTAPRRYSAYLLVGLSLFALLLAALGIYSVSSLAVTERTREIGLRMALGASRQAVRRLILRQAALPILLGAIAGLLAAIAVAQSMKGLLFQVTTIDPLTLIATAIFLVTMALCGCFPPAQRASRLDPVKTLRVE